jgi:hypothetical protein
MAAIPAIDANICSGWTEQNINLFNKLDFYLAALQAKKRKTWMGWSKFCGKVKWQPNMGATMKGVRKEPSPNLRQFAFPTVLSGIPKKDIIDIREMTVTTQVSRHRFESPVLNFLPDFQDFMTNHVSALGEDIEEKKLRYEDIFIRGNIFHNSPHVWIPNRAAGEMVIAPMGDGNAAGTSGKTTAWLSAILPEIGQPGYLGLQTINKLVTAMEVDLRVPAFKGSGQPTDDVGLNDMYCLVLSAEAWNQFTFDPWVLANKKLDFDVVNQSFRGSLFGRVTCKLEDMPLRIAADGTFPAPEIRVSGGDAYNEGESVVNPDYQDAEYEVAFLIGTEGYKSLEVGPPPSAFTNGGYNDKFRKMTWNGELMLTKDFLIECVDDEGNVRYEQNSYGEYLKFQSQLALGIIGQQKRNIVPIIFKRTRGAVVPA